MSFAKKPRLDPHCKPVPVLGVEYTRDVETVSMYVAPIRNKRATSRLVKELTIREPLGQFQHLKRVRSNPGKGCAELEILLCLQDKTLDYARNMVNDDDVDISRIRTVNVSSAAPLTRRQYIDANALWPVQFHEDKYIAQVISGEHFSEDDLHRIRNFMEMAIETAEEDRPAALIVDPVTSRVVATALDDRNSHPAQHATMLVIDRVARTQGGGVWNPLDLAGNDIPGQHLLLDKQGDAVGVDKSTTPYLCTGYEMYITREPCTMCSMALVHSRISRVFYGIPNVTEGALGSKRMLHTLGGLNHRFQVWKNVLAQECAEAMKVQLPLPHGS